MGGKDARHAGEDDEESDEQGGSSHGRHITGSHAGMHAITRSGMWLAIKRPEFSMKNLILNVPTLLFVVGTRAALGAGIGMLLSGKLSEAHRRRVGLTLVAIGAATTIPAARAVRRGIAARSAQEQIV
jgi:hypothetical protein